VELVHLLPEHYEWISAVVQIVNVTEPATSAQTPLSIAYEKGLYDVVALLLDKVQKEAEVQLASGMQVDVAGGDGVTPLHLACLHGDMAKAALLICKGVDVNEVDALSQSPLHVASANGHVFLVELLLSKGADMHNRNGCMDPKSRSVC
jgi:hypothetical protein